MIKTTNLSKIYKVNVKEAGFKGSLKSLIHSEWKEKVALDGISFNMHEGQTLACIGENGAGKSTLIKLLIGILTPSSGSIEVFGNSPKKDRNNYLKKIGVIFGQKTNLWVDIPVIESYNAMKILYKVDDKEFKRNFDMVVETLALQDILKSPARKLSLGQRMKADIGMVFLHSPKLLYLDEPTIGLDVNVKIAIRKFIKEMNKEKGTSILLTSHDLDDIEEICEDTIILSKGKIFYDGSLNKLKQNYVTTKNIEVVGKSILDIKTLLPNIQTSEDGIKTKLEYNTKDYESAEVLSALSKSYEIEDIFISEPDIESVVSKIFSGGK